MGHGRQHGDTAGEAVAASDFALGAGWGGTATIAVAAGSNDQRGRVTVTASATTPAQATATITLTFKRPYPSAPFAVVVRAGGTGGVTEQVGVVTTTATTLVITHSVLPVAGNTYIFNYFVQG